MTTPDWSDFYPAGNATSYGDMTDTLRIFLDRVAAARPDETMTQALAEDLRAWSLRLAPLAVPEAEQPFAHQPVPGRGQTMTPAFFVDVEDAQSIRGHVTFGRYFLGGNGAVHGGVLSLLFDDVLGRLANKGARRLSRTAFLHVDYRAITPIEKRLTVHSWFVSEEGRKRVLRAELHDGDTLCAKAEGLWVELKPSQP